MKLLTTLTSIFAGLVLSACSFAQPLSQVWQQPYNGGGVDQAYSVCADKRGNTIVTGRSVQGDNGINGYDYYTVKYDAAGNEVWHRTHDVAHGEDVGKSVTCDNDGNAYVTGYSTNATGNYDVYTVKYRASDGFPLWETT